VKSSPFKDVLEIKYWKCPSEIGLTTYIKHDTKNVTVEVLHCTCISRFDLVDTNLLRRKRFAVTDVSEMVGLRKLEYLQIRTRSILQLFNLLVTIAHVLLI
jgi:hypothetical protein